MNNTLISIALFIGLVAGLAKLLDIWLNKASKEKLKDYIAHLWIKLDDAEPKLLAQVPLRFLSSLYNSIFGESIFSKKAYLRSSIISSIVLVALLSVSGIYTGHLFSMKVPPWNFYKSISDKYSNVSKEKPNNTKSLDDETLTSLQKHASFYGTKGWIIGHSIGFVLFTLVFNALFDAISLSIMRMMLREALSSSHNIGIFSILFTNLIIAFLLATLVSVIVVILYVPEIALMLRFVINLAGKYPALTTVGLFAAVVWLWKLGGTWVYIIALTTVIPIILLCFALIVYFILYPLKNKIYQFMHVLLIKIIDYEKGIFAFLAVLLGTIGSLIGLLAKAIK